jgi:hypothetical protein
VRHVLHCPPIYCLQQWAIRCSQPWINRTGQRMTQRPWVLSIISAVGKEIRGSDSIQDHSPCKIYVGQSGTGTVCLRLLSFSPVSTHLPKLHIHLHLNMLLSEGQAGKAWKSSEKQCSFGHQRALDTEILSVNGCMDGWMDGLIPRI